MSEAPYQIKIMAGIGNVCVQFANLELILAATIFSLLNIDRHRGAIVTGGMDMKARFAVALALLEEMRSPGSMRRRLKAIQAEFRTKNLGERRNQAVHGAHKFENDKYTLTMLRYPKAQREQEITPDQLAQLGSELQSLSHAAYDLLGDIERWAVRHHGKVNTANDLECATPVTFRELAQSLYASVKHFWRHRFG